jgi:X-Pro dipeptidyl-peptidase
MPICAEPDARATVIVGDVDSGVTNHAVAGGCAINDHVLDDQEWGNHGQFVVHVEEVADLLTTAGLINAREVAALVSAAARSDVGG